MADFCKQCSTKNFGEDNGDLRGLSTDSHTKDELFAHVICEGCGVTLVDHEGRCVNKDCLEKHMSAGDAIQLLKSKGYSIKEICDALVELGKREKQQTKG